MTLPIMLSCKGLATYRAYKWPLVGVSTKMRSQIVCASEPLGAKGALECSRVLLDALGVPTLLRSLVFRVCESESNDVVGDR